MKKFFCPVCASELERKRDLVDTKGQAFQLKCPLCHGPESKLYIGTIEGHLFEDSRSYHVNKSEATGGSRK